MDWTIERLNSLITDQVEESLTLEYKAAAALARTDSKKAEITKDVSSFANSAGGTIIYGMKEHDLREKRHLPANIDPVDRTQFSKEWLEQVINNIRPRVDGISIYPVAPSAESTMAIYVLEIPQSATAHQAVDLRYYKRFNFESVPMYDYEIRDVLARAQHPFISLEFEVKAESHVDIGIFGLPSTMDNEFKYYDTFNLRIRAVNSGSRYAQFVNAILHLPAVILREEGSGPIRKKRPKESPPIVERFIDNTRRDVVSFKAGAATYGPSRHEPILPKLTRKLEDIELSEEFDKIDTSGMFIEWSVYADNAPPISGKIAVQDIVFTDSRRRSGGSES